MEDALERRNGLDGAGKEKGKVMELLPPHSFDRAEKKGERENPRARRHSQGFSPPERRMEQRGRERLKSAFVYSGEACSQRRLHPSYTLRA